MADHGKRRHGNASAQRPEGIRLLLAGQSAADVAETLGVGPRTVGRWKDSVAYSEAKAARDTVVMDRVMDDAVALGDAVAAGVALVGRRIAQLSKDNDEPTMAEVVEVSAHLRTLAALNIDAGDGEDVSKWTRQELIDGLMLADSEEPKH